MMALGEDEDAAEAIGVNVLRVKRQVYLISAFLTALAGTFYVQYIYFIDPNTAFSFNVSVEAALVSIVGGIGTLWGPVVGTVLLEATSALLQSWLGSKPWRGAADGIQPHPDRRDPVAPQRTARRPDRGIRTSRSCRPVARAGRSASAGGLPRPIGWLHPTSTRYGARSVRIWRRSRTSG
jgi:hypothetical protein